MEKLKNGTIISKPKKPRRAQKGDAHVVIVFHTSKSIGVEECMADVDIIVNGGKKQPDCDMHEDGEIFCNHFAAFILRELIVKTELPEEHKNSTLSGIERQDDGYPVVYRDKECAAHTKGYNCKPDEKFHILFKEPPSKEHRGIYHMYTAAVFETPERQISNKLKKRKKETVDETRRPSFFFYFGDWKDGKLGDANVDEYPDDMSIETGKK